MSPTSYQLLYPAMSPTSYQLLYSAIFSFARFPVLPREWR